MTLQDVSNASGVDARTLSDFERGMAGLHIDTLKKIADALEITELSAALAPYVADPERAEACIAAYVAAMEEQQEMYWESMAEPAGPLAAAAAEAKKRTRQMREEAPLSGVDPREMDRAWDLRCRHRPWDSPAARARK